MFIVTQEDITSCAICHDPFIGDGYVIADQELSNGDTKRWYWCFDCKQCMTALGHVE